MTELEPDTLLPSPYGPPVTPARDRATEEYAAFGPWISPVLEADDVPPVFAQHPIDFAASELVLKFPRPESRRDLRLGMHLYNHLIVLTPTHLSVLERHDDDFAGREFPLDSIAALRAGTRLLDGWLTLQFTTGESYAVPFNGSALESVTGLVDRVRALIAPPTPPSPVPTAAPALAMDALGRSDALFTNVANTLVAREPHAQIVAAEGRATVQASGEWMDGLSHLLRPAVRHGSVIAQTPSELIVFSRVDPITRTKSPEVSLARTVVPRRAIDRVDVAGHDRYPGTSVVTLVCGEARVPLVLSAESPAVPWLVEAFAR